MRFTGSGYECANRQSYFLLEGLNRQVFIFANISLLVIVGRVFLHGDQPTLEKNCHETDFAKTL